MSQKGFIPLLILVIGVLIISGTIIGVTIYIKNTSKDRNAINPTSSSLVTPAPFNSSTPSPTSLVENTNCTRDEECSSGYKCQAIESQGTVCPAGQSIPGKGFIPSTVSCTPSTKVIRGVCKLSEGDYCQNANDCYIGLICHGNKCTSQINEGSCTGLDDKSCPNGYKCVQACGPPIARAGDQPPGYFCKVEELANKPRNCPICLASNTQISTPTGDINVKDLKVGMKVYSTNRFGQRIIADVIKISNTPTPITHKVVHLVLTDGRQLWVSPNHPTVSSLEVGQLQVGQSYNSSVILIAELIPYWDNKTYDLLPNSDTGFYYANGILMGTTLK